MSLREIIYLDRTRVESYLSQLVGGLTVSEDVASEKSQKLTGEVRAGVKFIEFSAGGERADGTTSTSTRVPAHAILATLEQALQSQGLLLDATTATVLPGHLAVLRGDATFESWGMLASVADSVQGIAQLAAKIYLMTRGTSDFKALRQQLDYLDKLTKSHRGPAPSSEQRTALASAIGKVHTLLSIVEDRYIDDAKGIVKLFFQDQNHVRLTAKGKTYVGLMRRENLVGSTMEELLFDYGGKPQHSFGALFYVAEFGRDQSLSADDLTARFTNFKDSEFSFGMIQRAIRDVGTFLLDCAEELRRPTGTEAAFIVPLAIYREVHTASANSVSNREHR
jgi:hypothetical protein